MNEIGGRDSGGRAPRVTDFVQVDGKLLRSGFTTGTAATAAAMAAAQGLLTPHRPDTVQVRLPRGEILEIPVVRYETSAEGVRATVVKDGGDDMDITHGLEIQARVISISEQTIVVKGGPGVGKVTKPGLSVMPGQWAINPTPVQMIKDNLAHFLESGHGLEVTISVPEGEAAALKTFNPRLGIEGGISIIGTTGIVLPMSEDGFKQSLVVSLNQAIALGQTDFVYVFGNYGEAYALANGVPAEAILKTSNFIGFMLDEARVRGVKSVTIIGNIGKLIKVSGGIFHTHSHVSDAKKEIMIAHLALMGAPYTLIKAISQVNTMEEAVSVLETTAYTGIYQILADLAKKRCQEHVRGELATEIVLFSDKQRFLASTESRWQPSAQSGDSGQDLNLSSCQPSPFEFDPLGEFSSSQLTSLPVTPVPPVPPVPPVTIVGIGPGRLDLLTQEALDAIASAQRLIGAKRHLDLFPQITAQKHIVNGRANEMLAIIGEDPWLETVILASGDPLVFGIGDSIRQQLPFVKILNGISALQYIFTKIPVNMNDVFLTSCHGRPLDIEKLLAAPIEKIAMVTDAINHPGVISKALLGQRVTLYIGSNLGYPNETILSGGPEDLQHFDGQGLHVLVISKEGT